MFCCSVHCCCGVAVVFGAFGVADAKPAVRPAGARVPVSHCIVHC